MSTKAPGCRVVCNDQPGEAMDQLVAAFRKLRTQGLSEAQALSVSRDVDQVTALLPTNSMGALRGNAEAMISSGCAECAVNLAYSK